MELNMREAELWNQQSWAQSTGREGRQEGKQGEATDGHTQVSQSDGDAHTRSGARRVHQPGRCAYADHR